MKSFVPVHINHQVVRTLSAAETPETAMAPHLAVCRLATAFSVSPGHLSASAHCTSSRCVVDTLFHEEA